MAETLLNVGTAVPDIVVKDQDGNETSLSQFKGQKVILFFYPRANTPGCTKEACSLRDHHETLVEKGYTVIGVSPDNPKPLQNFIAKFELPFTLWSDPDNELTKAFGAWGLKKMRGKEYMGLLRSTFVIDEGGNISHVVPKVKTAEHAQQLLELIEE